MEVMDEDGADEGFDEDDEDANDGGSVDLEASSGDDDEEDTDEDQSFEQDDEALLCKLEDNKSHTKYLEIETGCYLPSSAEQWERTGNAIGSHSHLDTLSFSFENISEEHTKIIFRGVARNKSIRTLNFEDCKNMTEECTQIISRSLAKNKTIRTLIFHKCNAFREVFRILAPFFENNRNFEELHFSRCHFESAGSLTFALSEFTSLKKFTLEECDFDNETLGQLIVALSGHLGLSDVSLNGTRIEKKAGAALAAQLCNSECRIILLNLEGAKICNEGAIAFASGLAENRTLKTLCLECIQNMTDLGWVGIFTSLRSQHCRIEVLWANDNQISNQGANALAASLAETRTLKKLELARNQNINEVGWSNIFTALRSQHCRIEELLVSDNQINDVAANSLAMLLRTNGSLISLNLDSIFLITTVGWREIFAALQSPNCKSKSLDLSSCELGNAANALPAALGSTSSAMESLSLNDTSIDNTTAISLAGSLVSNTNLTELELHDNNITITGWSAFSNALCDTSSIMGTFTSNHTLQTLGGLNNQTGVEALLLLNRDHSKDQAARLKIIKTHFSRGFVAQPFMDIKLVVLPHAIAWMGSYNESGRVDERFYGFLRNTTSWFDRAGT